MYRALAIEASALDRMQMGFDFDHDWFEEWSAEVLPKGIRRVEAGKIVYLLGPRAEACSRMMVIDLEHSGLFGELAAKDRPQAFQRLVRLGQSLSVPGRLPLPTAWAPVYGGNLISIHSNGFASGERARIESDRAAKGTHHAFVFSLFRGKHDLNEVAVNYETFDAAVAHFEEAIIRMLEADPGRTAEQPTTLVLSALEDRLSMGRSLDEWLTRCLTKEQLAFVNAPLKSSIRLVGAAGTGKTLSLVVKCLKEFERRGPSDAGYRCLFLTHSQATVETVREAARSMDRGGVMDKWADKSLLKVCTLLELANDAMKYELGGLEPLSNDGQDGRKMQLEVIESKLEHLRRSSWITFRARCSPVFVAGVEHERGTPEARAFAYEIMNEFACVLEAQGVRQSAERRASYMAEKRKAWMMPLAHQEDRRVVLSLYDEFRSFLRETGVIGADQMIADYLGFLDSNRWDNTRARDGYDAVYVDELHLFNRQERMTLHQLMRDVAAPPIVVMAYDSKQSVRDTFYGLAAPAASGRFDMQLGATEKFQLNEGFRHTPEIAKVLEWIDQSFPAAGLSEELGPDWQPIKLNARNASGDKPTLFRATSVAEVFRAVVPRARRAALRLQKGRRVAALCASEIHFDMLCKNPHFQEAFLAITDRDQLSNLRHAGKRFVLSMPEYVAGIQFDTVYLLGADDLEVSEGPGAIGALRQFVSQLYLGGSRAERVLEIYSSEDRGGPSRALKHAIDQGALRVLDISDAG